MPRSTSIRMEIVADHWLKMFVFVLALWHAQEAQGSFDITYLQSAISKGAVCLDGSAPAYYLDKGSGSGANSWLVHLEGGGWCMNENDCYDRSINSNGSSKAWGNGSLSYNAGGILSSSLTVNPDFHNWNRVYVKYCDGGSFSGNIEELSPVHQLYRRGARVFNAVVEDLLEIGMKNADNAILSGNSAGGLACMLQCENFRALVPTSVNVKCVADSGFFIRAQNLPGAFELREAPFASVVSYHGLENILHKSCTSKMNASLCLFPENFIEYIQTPLFMVNSVFDKIQLIMWVFHVEPGWSDCIKGNQTCTSAQLQGMQDYRTASLQALPKPGCPSRGLFIDTCYIHDHVFFDKLWNITPTLNNMTVAKAVGDWFFDRSCSDYIDNADVPNYCNK